jgi:CheY-like chemotaxis protein
MPNGMSGVELARAARQRRPALKVLLTSGYGGTALERLAREGEFAVLSKPYRQPELAARIRAALEEGVPSPAAPEAN